MSEYGTEMTLKVDTSLDIDIEVDDDGICYVVVLQQVGDNDIPCEARVELSAVTEEIKNSLVDSGDYTQLYIIAHELTRQGERLREVARNMEDSVIAVSNHFDLT